MVTVQDLEDSKKVRTHWRCPPNVIARQMIAREVRQLDAMDEATLRTQRLGCSDRSRKGVREAGCRRVRPKGSSGPQGPKP